MREKCIEKESLKVSSLTTEWDVAVNREWDERNLEKEIENLKEIIKENEVRRKKEIVRFRKVGMHQ